MEAADAIEGAMAGVFKEHGFRKRGRSWFHTTRADQYQVVNLQKSSWGGGDCYLNLGSDPVVPEKGFRGRTAGVARGGQTRCPSGNDVPWIDLR